MPATRSGSIPWWQYWRPSFTATRTPRLVPGRRWYVISRYHSGGLMRGLFVAVLLGSVLVARAGRVAAQDAGPNVRDQIELNRNVIQQKRQEILQKALELTPQQSEEFWPVYHDYENELSKIGDEKTRLLQSYAKDYSNMSEK